jgi:hypothetical protein
VNRLFNDGTFTPAQIESQLQLLEDAGATLARSDALWEAAEPHPPAAGAHRYDWLFDDLIAASLAAHHLTWLPIIDYSAPWAQSIPGRDHSPPTSASAFAAYAAAVALRYGAGGSFWKAHPEVTPEPVDTLEIWNEPDNPSFWSPRPDPPRYAELYAVSRNRVKRADPSARVIIGGLTHPEVFLPALLTAAPDLRGRIDGVAIHPYAPDPAVLVQRVRTARAVLRSLDLGSVPLYVTEFGWTTSPPGALNYLPARLRPAYIAQTLAALGHTSCGIAASVLYTWVTPDRTPANPQDWFGISPLAGASSRDAAAFAEGLRQAGSPGPAGAC